jgi:hypothetical protein
MIQEKVKELEKLLEFIPKINKTVSLLQEEFKNFDKTNLIEDLPNSIDTFEEEFLYVYEFVLYEGLSEDVCNLIMSLTEILYNWNRMSRVRSNNMVCLTLMLNRVLELRDITLKQANLTQEMSGLIGNFHMWNPPAFSISKEYLEQLLTENEEQQCKN